MKSNISNQNKRKKNLIRIVLGTLLILLVPLVAMQFSDAVNWGPLDFVTIGALLIGAGFIFELVTANASNVRRTVIGAVITAAVILVWVELAVGIFN